MILTELTQLNLLRLRKYQEQNLFKLGWFCFVMEEDVEGKVKTFNHNAMLNEFTDLGSKVVNE